MEMQQHQLLLLSCCQQLVRVLVMQQSLLSLLLGKQLHWCPPL